MVHYHTVQLPEYIFTMASAPSLHCCNSAAETASGISGAFLGQLCGNND